jgi:hypothetical protein
MIRRMLLCLPLLSVSAAAQLTFGLNAEESAELANIRAQAVAQKPQVVAVNQCWTRQGEDPVYDSSKLPADFCVRSVSIRIVGDGGTLSVDGAYTPAGAAARKPVDATPQDMSSYKESIGGGSVYSAYVFSESNKHGDTGSIWVSFTVSKDGEIDPKSVYANFGVGCPHEECAAGEEPGVLTKASPWR